MDRLYLKTLAQGAGGMSKEVKVLAYKHEDLGSDLTKQVRHGPWDAFNSETVEDGCSL